MTRILWTPGVTRRSLAWTVTGAILIAAASGARAGQRGTGPQGGSTPTARALNGAIDIHVHSFPDSTDRSVDGLEAASMARAHGMRGIVLKNHYDPTAPLAYMVGKQVAGLEVFGGVDLNLPVGGMNPVA